MQDATFGTAGTPSVRHPVTAAMVALAVLATSWVVVRVLQGARLLGAPSYQGAR